MDCKTTRERLEGYLAGSLDRFSECALEAHLSRCAACRDLIGGAPIDPLFPLVEAPAGLADDVMRRTSGSACDQAASLLADRVDEPLESLDAELLQLHLGSCGDCLAISEALGALQVDLPAMRELELDDAFVGDVMSSTVGSRRPGLAERFVRIWDRLVQRPRFAWEAAYVGAMLIWLTVGTPVATLHGAMLDAMTSAESFPAQSYSTLSVVRDGLVDMGQNAVARSQQTWSGSLEQLDANLGRRVERTAQPRRELRAHGSDLKQAALSLDLGGSSRALANLAGDARNLIGRFVVDSVVDDDGPNRRSRP